MANVLIIDDDRMICDMLTDKVDEMGHAVSCASTLTEGFEKARAGTFDVVFLDVCMPDGNGLDALPEIREASSSPEVIIITGEGDPDGAELAIKSGAWDYIEKGSSLNAMILPLVRALQYREEKVIGPPVALKLEGVVGVNLKMRACFDRLAQAASSEVSVLITGETGTGKELFARAIHQNSSRAAKPFVVVDCAALPETLVESILFGHEKGAYTGADKACDGLIKQANGGTLFLDEVGELPLSVQKSFLRVLQERRFRPVGGGREVESNFRLIAATNRNLVHLVDRGRFRQDLLFRLRSLTVHLPPLRERMEDIRELTMHHMARLCRRYGVETKGFSPEFFETLASYRWPGNVRELLNALEGALAKAGTDPILFPKHLPGQLRVEVARESISKKAPGQIAPEAAHRTPQTLPTLNDFREAGEERYFQDLMLITRGNIREACRISGLSRSRLYALLKKHKLLTPTEDSRSPIGT